MTRRVFLIFKSIKYQTQNILCR